MSRTGLPTLNTEQRLIIRVAPEHVHVYGS
jgi:hypothetical protein